MAIIRTPVPDYTGPGPGGIHFLDGAAESDDEAVIGYCRGAGYEVDGEVLNPLRPAAAMDVRDVTVRRVGAALRDAAVDPREGDHQAPPGAGTGDPHGPNVVAPDLTVLPPPVPQTEEPPENQDDFTRPSQADPVADWRTWAAGQADGDTDRLAWIEKATKAELIKAYGG
ncbi:hypothetical protein ACIQOW_03685 [Kitasatospora sp. NPDC091335]|uniref:hypothetical protein n=1 Tax=Kitasatospora sp. NPDC091335 TaxID=3364085 RepID=UPI0037FF790F